MTQQQAETIIRDARIVAQGKKVTLLERRLELIKKRNEITNKMHDETRAMLEELKEERRTPESERPQRPNNIINREMDEFVSYNRIRVARTHVDFNERIAAIDILLAKDKQALCIFVAETQMTVAKKEEIPTERWRASMGEKYYTIAFNFAIQESRDMRLNYDDKLYADKNYFKSVEEAKLCMDGLHEIFKRNA